MSGYLTPAEAAVVARRHVVTIHKALEAGALHGSQRTKHGRWLIRPACLDAYIDGRPCEHRNQSTVRPLRQKRAV